MGDIGLLALPGDLDPLLCVGLTGGGDLLLRLDTCLDLVLDLLLKMGLTEPLPGGGGGDLLLCLEACLDLVLDLDLLLVKDLLLLFLSRDLLRWRSQSLSPTF